MARIIAAQSPLLPSHPAPPMLASWSAPRFLLFNAPTRLPPRMSASTTATCALRAAHVRAVSLKVVYSGLAFARRRALTTCTWPCVRSRRAIVYPRRWFIPSPSPKASSCLNS
eukprot:scaffold71244_cov65-Phaeocystis_antarctica.AAC.3